MRGKVLSIALALAMVLPGTIIFGEGADASEQAGLEINSPVMETQDTISYGDVHLLDIRAPPYYRPAFTDKDNQLELRIQNDGDSFVFVKVDLYHVEPDGESESFLKSVWPVLIFKGQEKTFNAFGESEDMWQPTEIGRNWIRGEIYVYEFGEGWVLSSDFKESFWAVPGSRPILELGDTEITEPTVWDNLTVIVDGDVTVAENGELSTLNTDVFSDDLDVSGTYNIDEGYIHNMECSSDGEFGVNVKSTGTLNIYGSITNDPDDNRYWFYMNGTLNLNGIYGGDNGTVEFTYGDASDLSKPGGIICTTSNVNIENGATIRNSASHGIYFMNNSGGVVKDSYIVDNGGDGIVCVEDSSPTIERNEITWNDRYGIYAKNSTPVIKDNDLIQYNGEHGIYLEDVTSSSAKVEGNTIKQNYASGIYATASNITIANNTISSNGQGLIFADYMESGVENWAADGMWHRVNNESGEGPSWNISYSGDWSWWYGNDTDGDYDDGTHNWGNLTSGIIDLQDATAASLVFWSWYETDTTGTATDHRNITIQNATLKTSFQLEGDTMNEWTRHVLNISQFAGKNINITFSFNTTNDQNNDYQGWYVDDVEVIASYPAAEGHGIYLYNTSYTNITNNNIYSNNWNGIYCEGSENISISDNQITNDTKMEIGIHSSKYCTLTNNNMEKDSDGILHCFGCWESSNILIEKSEISGGHEVVLLYDCSDTTIESSNISNAVGAGVLIRLSSDVLVTKNNLTDNNRDGVYYCTSSATIHDNRIHNNSRSGIYYGDESYASITKNLILGNGNGTSPWFAHGGGIVDYGTPYSPTIDENYLLYNYKGIDVAAAVSEVTITNSTISDSVLYDVFVSESDLTTLNTTFDDSSAYVGNQGGNLIVQWYMDVHVNDSSGSNYNNVELNLLNENYELIEIDATDAYGWTSELAVTERIQHYSGDTRYTPHKIMVSDGDLFAIESIDLTATSSVFMDLSYSPLHCVVDDDDIALLWNYSSYPDSSYFEIYCSITPDGFDFTDPINTTSDANVTEWVHEGAVNSASEYYYVLAIFDSGDQLIYNSEIIGKYNISFTSGWNVFGLPLLPFPDWESRSDYVCDWMLIDNDSPDAISSASSFTVFDDGSWRARLPNTPEFAPHREINPIKDGFMVYMDNTDYHTFVGWPIEQTRLSTASDALTAPSSPDIVWDGDDLNISWNSVTGADHYEVFASGFRILSSFDFTDPVYSGTNTYWLDSKANETTGERYYVICAVESDDTLGDSTYSIGKHTIELSSGWSALTTPFEPFDGETCGNNHRLCDWTLIDQNSPRAIPSATSLSVYQGAWLSRIPTAPWFVPHREIDVIGDCFMVHMDNIDIYTWIS